MANGKSAQNSLVTPDAKNAITAKVGGNLPQNPTGRHRHICVYSFIILTTISQDHTTVLKALIEKVQTVLG